MDRDGMDSSWMIQKIHSLTEKVSVLAQGSKLVELRTQLQLLIGYIHTVDADSLAALSNSENLRNSLICEYSSQMSLPCCLCMLLKVSHFLAVSI